MNFNQALRALSICALGYFIDVFDHQLFVILRTPSLTGLGVPLNRLADVGAYIFNIQLIGMVLGAFLWGWLGDRYGRVKALYGSILIYSIGTFACGFVHDPITYGLLRFFTGFGLAGEAGAAVTLIAEMLPPRARTWGIVGMACIGQLGPVGALAVSWFASWRATYMIAGVLGLAIFVVRMRFGESILFKAIEKKNITRGSLRLLGRKKHVLAILFCLVFGLAINFFWYVLNFFSTEFSHIMLAPGEAYNQKITFFAFYAGTACGAVLSGVVCQFLQSRRKSVQACLVAGYSLSFGFLLYGPHVKLSAPTFYLMYFLFGSSAGCWVLMLMIFAEHFGTNIRATTTVVLTNLVRGLSIVTMQIFLGLRSFLSLPHDAALVAAILFGSGLFALTRLRETHGLDLDYIEEIPHV